MGGQMSNVQLDLTVYKFSTTTATASWNKVVTTGLFPSLYGHAYCVQSNMMYMYGGRRSGPYSNDLHSFNMETGEWRKFEVNTTTTNDILPQVVHATMVWHNNKLLILGGDNYDHGQHSWQKDYHASKISSCTGQMEMY